MDQTFTTSAKSVLLSVVGLRKDGTPGEFASPPVFTVESGAATLEEVADANSQQIDVDNSTLNSVVIRVDANCDLKGGTRVVSAKLFLSVTPGAEVDPTEGEVVSLQLTAQ